MDSNNDEWKRILYGEDFERMDSDSDKTKDFDKSSSSVFKSLSDEFELGGSSYVEGNELVSSEMMLDFDLENFQVEPKNDILNPKVLVLDPGILDVFDPLHPPLIDFHVSLLKLFSKKIFKSRNKNAT
ncbi:hypothetical protein Tco_0230178, partial [Tanacetum coccineum]